jgi:uncharacterized protein YqgV (UPF0045/DUF77 family)
MNLKTIEVVSRMDNVARRISDLMEYIKNDKDSIERCNVRIQKHIDEMIACEEKFKSLKEELMKGEDE